MQCFLVMRMEPFISHDFDANGNGVSPVIFDYPTLEEANLYVLQYEESERGILNS